MTKERCEIQITKSLWLKYTMKMTIFQCVVTKTGNEHKPRQMTTYHHQTTANHHKPRANDHKPPVNNHKPPANNPKPPANNRKRPNKPFPNSNYLIFFANWTQGRA